jgi:hypothetical protein
MKKMGKGLQGSTNFLGGNKIDGGTRVAGHGSYLKKHTESLVKDVGIEPACE